MMTSRSYTVEEGGRLNNFAGVAGVLGAIVFTQMVW
jgi:hypothetical protein